jgi:hypothetical protein
VKAFRKDNLAIEILCYDHESYDDMVRFARLPDYPEFEVRTVGSKGIVQIKFPHQEWITPREWANNHRNTILNNLFEDYQRVRALQGLRDVVDIGLIPQDYLTEVRSMMKQRLSEFIHEQGGNGTISEVADFVNSLISF